jgi:DNA repair protein RadC
VPKEVLGYIRLARCGAALSWPKAVNDHMCLHLGMLEHAVLCVPFLYAQRRIIELQQMFRGTRCR